MNCKVIKGWTYNLFFIVFLSFLVSLCSQQVFSAETDLENLRSFNPDLTRAYDKIKIQEAWTAIKQSGIHLSPVRIGIVDTGVDPNHPEFQGVNLGAIKREELRDFEPSGHGTQIVGVIGANNLSETQPIEPSSPQMNGILSGVLDTNSYTLEIIPCEEGETDLSSALNLVLEKNIQVLNMSFGTPLCSASPIRSKISEILLGKSCFSKEEEFLNYVDMYMSFIKKYPEVIFVVAAGNEDIDVGFTMPAGLEFYNVIVVGAIDLGDQRAQWFLPSLQSSNYGKGVDIAAPEEKIYAPKPDGGYDENFNATSAAAPLVTGVVGLMLSLNPNLKPKEIRDILIETGDTITTDKPLGGKRLNALNAVTKVIQQIQTSKIIVEATDNIWEITTESPPPELVNVASNVTPRVVIEYADSIYHSDLNTPTPELVNAASSVTPRIIVEYADSISSIALARPSFFPAPSENPEKVYKSHLHAGLNIISIPLNPGSEWRISDLINHIGKDNVTMVIWYDVDNKKFVTYLPTFPETSPTNTVIKGDQGYILNLKKDVDVTFTGTAWETKAAPPAVNSPLWAFVVAGMVYKEDGINLANDRFTASVENLRTGAIATDIVGFAADGYFVAPFVNMARRSVAQLGDSFRITIKDASGSIVSGPFIHQLKPNHITDALMMLKLRIGNIIPQTSHLYQNYPNPFNPETWIPYQLANPAEVTIKIYDVKGQLIRILNLGQKSPGTYLSKERAAYWDGKNQKGERVSSGAYFYHFQAGPFQATKKLAIAK